MLAGVNKDGHDSGTTKAAVSEGTLVVRDQDKQAQDLENLSRDAENANGTINQIFDKEKEQKRIQQAQLIGELSTQVSDIVRTQGAIAAATEAKEKMGKISQEDKDKARADWIKANPGKEPDETQLNKQVYQNFYDKAFNDTKLGTGGAVQQGIQAATAAVQGLAGGDIAAAIANGAAPYLAEVIGHKMGIDDNSEAKAIAHAIVGAALAAAQGQNAAGGATGAALGELTAKILKDQLYGADTKISDLTETQKQTLSALATLSSGLAGGLVGDSTGSAVYAAQAGKTTAENNYLSVSEKTELELAKQKLNDPDKNVREKAAKDYIRLAEEDVSRDLAVIDACGNGKAATAGCQAERAKAFAAKGGYEAGQYISKFSQQYPDAYNNIVNLLAATSLDGQNQQQVTEGLTRYFMSLTGADYEKAKGYAETKQGADIIIASIALGANLQAAYSYLSSKGAPVPNATSQIQKNATANGYKVSNGANTLDKTNSNINTNIVPRKASSLAGGPLENAKQISGRFKIEGGPKNGTVYRADNQGNITSYAVYDTHGMITKRVDVTGAAHGGVSTPHVIEYGRNTLPNGQIRVQSPSTKALPRPVKQDEIP